MYYVIYGVILVMAIRCISYGAAEFKNRNYIGAAATILLAAGSAYSGFYIFN